MALRKENISALGLHLVPGAGDGILTYSDGIADVNYEHIDESKEKGDYQSNINKELRDAILSQSGWYEEEELGEDK